MVFVQSLLVGVRAGGDGVSACREKQIKKRRRCHFVEITAAKTAKKTCSSVMHGGAAVLVLRVDITPSFNDAHDAADAATGRSFV